jgi:hypothetical protein
MRSLNAATEQTPATVVRLLRPFFDQIFEKAIRILNAANTANINNVAELPGSLQPPKNLRDTDEDDVGVKTAATFENRNTVRR